MDIQDNKLAEEKIQENLNENMDDIFEIGRAHV